MNKTVRPAAGKQPRGMGFRGNDWLALSAALVTVALWSSNFPVIRYANQVYAPGHIALLRCAFAAAPLAVYAAIVRLRLPDVSDWPAFVFFGLCAMSLSSVGLAFGLETVSAGAGSLVIGTIPVFAALLAGAFLRERIGWIGWLGVAVSFAGVGVIAVGEGPGLRLNWGVALLMMSAFFQAVFYVFQKPYLRRYSPMEITCYIVWSGAAGLLIFAPGLPAAIAAAPLTHTLALAYQGCFPLAIAFATWSYALRHAKAAKVTSAVYFMPLLSYTLAYVWLAEEPSALSLLGGATAIGGMVLLNVWGR